MRRAKLRAEIDMSVKILRFEEVAVSGKRNLHDVLGTNQGGRGRKCHNNRCSWKTEAAGYPSR